MICNHVPAMRNLVLAFLAVLVVMGGGGASSAFAQGCLLITDPATFAAAANDPTPFTFNGCDVGASGFTNYGSGPLKVQGVTFSEPNGEFAVFSPNSIIESNFTTAYLGTARGSITLALPAGTTAFGADFASTSVPSFGDTMIMTIDGVATSPVSLQIAGAYSSVATFVGVVSATPFTTVVLTNVTDGALALDNVQVAPEPSTWTMLGLGTVGGCVAALRRRTAQMPAAGKRRTAIAADTDGENLGGAAIGENLVRLRDDVSRASLPNARRGTSART